MSERQLRLFAAPKPLLQRFGRDFFRSIPRQPGVYFLHDGTGRVLYIGQSQNLHDRIGSYRHVHPDRDSRKTVRLVHSVEKIDWEIWETPAEARVRESQLLRLHRPKFNVVNTYPNACLFIGLKIAEDSIELRLTRERQAGLALFGAFKGNCISGYSALARLIFRTTHQPATLAELPCRWLTADAPRRLSFDPRQLGRASVEALVAYLRGESAAFVQGDFPTQPQSVFEKNLWALDTETLLEFFLRGPQRIANLRRIHGLAEPWIEPDQLQDLLARGDSTALRP